MINNLKNEFNTAMIMITHDLGVVAETCDDVDVIYAGEILESGNKLQIFDNPSHPYTKGLFEALPNLNSEGTRLHPIAGLPPDPTNLPKGCAFSPRCPYATDKCREVNAELTEIEPGHFCRCHLVNGKEA